MTSEEKLEKIEELIAARDEITEQLLELMGAPVDEEGEVDEEEPAPSQKKKVRVCGQCGRPGHMRNQCDGNPQSSAPAKAQGKQRQPCKECESIGTRHFKGCSQAKPVGGWGKVEEPAEQKGRTILDAPVRLSKQEYNEVREQIDEGLTIEMISFSYPQVDIAEIRRAKISDSFTDYISGL
jgi:hypothetical protein